jgi:hypothetical protein
MKKVKKINTLDKLESEIYRLKLEAKNTEDKLEDNFLHFRNNFSSLLSNSLFCKKASHENGKENFFESVLNNERINTVLTRITDRLTNHAAAGFESLIDRLFHKKKHAKD